MFCGFSDSYRCSLGQHVTAQLRRYLHCPDHITHSPNYTPVLLLFIFVIARTTCKANKENKPRCES